MPIVIHLIPYDGIGGVESAARSSLGVDGGKIKLQLDYIYPTKTSSKQRLSTFNPIPLLRAICRLCSSNPDLLIVSLWRSCIVGLLVKLFRPHLKIVLFLHSPKHAHCFDLFFTRLTAKVAYRVWADCQETLTMCLPYISPDKGQVISFLTHRITALESHPVCPKFIFWGRIHHLKGLDQSLQVFAEVYKRLPDAHFSIIGPDAGDLERIQKLTDEMGLSDAVSFLGGMGFDEIVLQAQSASFYLQTSLLEGMAMSVVEAMQLGLVPIVTPVGEIKNYCRHAENALLIEPDISIVNKICEVLNDELSYMSLRKGAIETWAGKPLYSETVIEACHSILYESIKG